VWDPGCMNEWMGGWMDRHRHASLVGGRTDPKRASNSSPAMRIRVREAEALAAVCRRDAWDACGYLEASGKARGNGSINGLCRQRSRLAAAAARHTDLLTFA